MQMFTHELNPCKGWAADLNVLDKRGNLDIATNPVNSVFAGMVIHLSSAVPGFFRLGLPQALKATGYAPMPVFVFQNASDFDVSIDTSASSYFSAPGVVNIVGMSSADAAATSTVSQKPVIGGLVASGAYELETTEYLGTPTTGQVLTSLTKTAASNVNQTAALVNGVEGSSTQQWGRLQVAINTATAASDLLLAGCIVAGVVSDGVITPANNNYDPAPTAPNRLRFWPVYDVVWTTPT